MPVNQDEWLTIRTGISRAYWCDLEPRPAGSGRPKAKFKLATPGGDQHGVSWFDEMFCGEIRFPFVPERPGTFLITGSPGSGKSTLALELCYRLADTKVASHESHPASLAQGGRATPWICLYVSADVRATQVVRKAFSLRWESAHERFFRGSDKVPTDGFSEYGYVFVLGAEDIRNSERVVDSITEVLRTGIDIVSAFSPLVGQVKAEGLAERFLKWVRRPVAASAMKCLQPDVVVIDSLNLVKPDEKSTFFEKFLDATSGRTQMVVFVLDAGNANGDHAFWEYMCDYVLRLDYDRRGQYLLRNLEIVKARYQEHVLGKQQMKIYPARCENCDRRFEEHAASNRFDDCKLDARTMRRAHPYRHEGGVFIYPSIHYYLSKYKRRGPGGPPEFDDTRPENLNRIITSINQEQRGIYPRGRCTAFVGCRGGHKSHLGYLHLLHRLLSSENKEKESALVVSLRDDEEMTRRTMCNILTQEFSEEMHGGPEEKLAKLEEQNRLEVLYYPPGYITPEEFYHRMFMSVYRLKSREGTRLTVLFNSLDQLSARFPLCAEQGIFIPGIIGSLSGEGVTSIFVAVDEPGQPEEQYGLLPMADLVISFRRRRFSQDQYEEHIRLDPHHETREIDADVPPGPGHGKTRAGSPGKRAGIKDTIVLQVLRFAGGEMAGAAGILELVNQTKGTAFGKPGLHFVPIQPHLGCGEVVRE